MTGHVRVSCVWVRRAENSRVKSKTVFTTKFAAAHARVLMLMRFVLVECLFL